MNEDHCRQELFWTELFKLDQGQLNKPRAWNLSRWLTRFGLFLIFLDMLNVSLWGVYSIAALILFAQATMA